MTTEAEYVSNYGNVPRFDPAQGDSAWVVQSQQRDAGVEPGGGAPVAYSSLVRAAHLSPFEFNGGVFTVEATCSRRPSRRCASTGGGMSSVRCAAHPRWGRLPSPASWTCIPR